MNEIMTFIMLLFISTSCFAEINWSKEEKNIKLLKPSQFSSIPEKVINAAADAKCLIPQTDNPSPHNIVQGSFAQAHSKDWAILCSKDGKSSIFIAWEKGEPCPNMIETKNLKDFLQSVTDERARFSRLISAASEKRILQLQKEFGGPLPKHLDHEGIDDAFEDKASEIYFCEDGKWLKLQGSD